MVKFLSMTFGLMALISLLGLWYAANNIPDLTPPPPHRVPDTTWRVVRIYNGQQSYIGMQWEYKSERP